MKPPEKPTRFTRREVTEWMRSPIFRLPSIIVKSVLGYAFIVAGLIMLVTPGQGILTLLIGSALADYPGKLRFQRWLLRRRGVIGPINRLRRRARKNALVVGDNRPSPSVSDSSAYDRK